MENGWNGFTLSCKSLDFKFMPGKKTQVTVYLMDIISLEWSTEYDGEYSPYVKVVYSCIRKRSFVSYACAYSYTDTLIE